MTSSDSNRFSCNPDISGRGRDGHARCNSRAAPSSRTGGPFEASAVAIAVALLATLPQTASAASYTASNETELRNAITSANADPDPSATITLTGNIAMVSASTLSPTKPLTLDTAGFTLSGFDRTSGSAPGSSIQAAGIWTTSGSFKGGNAFGSGVGGTGFLGFNVQLTNHGTIRGGTGAAGTGGGGGIGAALGGAGRSHVNNGTIAGGTGGTNATTAAGGIGGNGASVIAGTLTNNGTITGGAGGANTAGTTRGGTGVLITSGGSLVNNGLVEGGAANGDTGGTGVLLNGNASITVTNNATIRGGQSNVGNAVAAGLTAAAPGTAATFINNGTIEGGTGAAAIRITLADQLTIVNSGTIRAGGSAASAIQILQSATQSIELELHAGSVIEGNVVASGPGINDTLRLGGAGNSSFDASGIGAAAQYRNFDRFQKTGASTWTLTGATTALTPWQVTGGTLSVASDGALGDAAGSLTLDGGTLQNTASFTSARAITVNAGGGTLRTDADLNFSGVIGGAGALTKTGAGALVLTGNNAAFAGGTSVEAGTLAVNGTLGGTLNVLGAGRLQGTGTVGSTTVAGTIAPGNSIGTLAVNGNYTQAPGSTYEVEVDPTSTASDLIHATGSASIASGARLNVVRINSGTYTVGNRYTVLTADGGITGTYGLAGDTALAFVQLVDSYDANNVYLSAEKVRSIADAGGTPNQAAVGAALDSLPVSNSLANAVTWLPNDFAARDALNQLSADIHASTKTALLEDSRFVREAAIDRLRGAACAPGSAVQAPQQVGAGCTPEGSQKHSAWTQVFGSWGSIDGDGNAAKLERDIGGFMVGTDTGVGAGWRVGALGGYSRASADTSARNSRSKTDSYHLGAYGGTQWGATALRLGASQSWNKTETNRSVAFAGFAGGLDAEYDSTTTQVFGELGHRIDMGRTTLEPFAGLAHVRLKGDAFFERGGAAALYSEGDSTDATFSTLGVRASMQASERIRVRGMLGWRHAFGDTTPASTHAFGGSLPFTLTGVPLAKDVAVLEAGIETQLRPNLTLGASYSGQFGDGLEDHGFKASLNWKF
jgi:outer membrane autotransporter protein